MCFLARNSALAKIFGLAKIANFAEFAKFLLNLRNAQGLCGYCSIASCILHFAPCFTFLLFSSLLSS